MYVHVYVACMDNIQESRHSGQRGRNASDQQTIYIYIYIHTYICTYYL